MERIILVTGAYQGIGAATSELLLEAGHTVILADRQDCEDQAKALRKSGLKAHSLNIDLTDSASFAAIAEQLQRDFGRLDTLVNNAAILVDMGKQPSELEEAMLRNVLEVNQIGPFLLTSALIPLLKKSDHCRIVNLSTQVAQLAQLSDMNSPIKDDICAAYQMSKIGVNAATVLYAKELESFGGKVNSCCPGWVDSAMNTEELPDYGENARPKTAREGADTTVWLATLPADGPTAGFFTDRTLIPW